MSGHTFLSSTLEQKAASVLVVPHSDEGPLVSDSVYTGAHLRAKGFDVCSAFGARLPHELSYKELRMPLIGTDGRRHYILVPAPVSSDHSWDHHLFYVAREYQYINDYVAVLRETEMPTSY